MGFSLICSLLQLELVFMDVDIFLRAGCSLPLLHCLLFQVIMHRKYLKGKRNDKSKQVPATNKYKMVQSDIPQMPEFLSRVANIPVVHTAIDYASDAYGKARVN